MLLSHSLRRTLVLRQIRLHHLLDEVLESGCWLPAQSGPGLGDVALQGLDLDGAQQFRIDHDVRPSVMADGHEGNLHEFSDRVGLARGYRRRSVSGNATAREKRFRHLRLLCDPFVRT